MVSNIDYRPLRMSIGCELRALYLFSSENFYILRLFIHALVCIINKELIASLTIKWIARTNCRNVPSPIVYQRLSKTLRGKWKAWLPVAFSFAHKSWYADVSCRVRSSQSFMQFEWKNFHCVTLEWSPLYRHLMTVSQNFCGKSYHPKIVQAIPFV